MKHSHQHPGPRGFRGDNDGREWGHHDDFGGHDGPGRGGRARRGGPGGPGGGPGRHGGGPGRRGGRPRGDVRAAILLLLAEQPRHGYDLIREIEDRSSGAWVPSPGSVYPTLQALEDEGLVSIDLVDGRKTASLTAAGVAWVEEHPHGLDAMFETDGRQESAIAIRREMGELREAAIHVARQQDRPELAAKVAEILATARRDLYRLLADEA